MGFSTLNYVIIFLVFAGILIVLRGFRGRLEWTHPACAKCRYDLRGLDPDEHKQCPECGADLTKPGAVRFGRGRRSYKVMALGLLLMLSPLLFIAGRQVQTTVTLRIAQQRPNERLIADLAANINNSQIWNELLNRHYDGRLSDADIAAAIDHLIAHLEKLGGAGNKLLHSDGQFLSVVIAEKRITSEQYERLCRACFSGLPTVSVPARVVSGGEIVFDISSTHWDLDGVTTIFALRDVTHNGKPLSFEPRGPASFRRGREELSGSGPWGVNGTLRIEAEPGEHELVFTIDFGVIEGFRGAFSPGSPPGPVEQWPQTVFRDVRELRAPFTILAPGESPIALVTDARYREQIIAGLRITGLRFGFEHGRQAAELIFNPTRDVPVALSFKMYVRAGEYEHEIGSFTNQGSRLGRSNFRRPLPNFPDVETVSVIFRPDPEAVEGRADWHVIWGEEIVIENVPVIRGVMRDSNGEE